MTIQALLFDLDETLIVEETVAARALLVLCKAATGTDNIDAEALANAVRQQARTRWRSSPVRAYCEFIGISSWEGLWGNFVGEDPSLQALAAWLPTYRADVWQRALMQHGLRNDALAARMAAALPAQSCPHDLLFPAVERTLAALRCKYKLAVVTNGAPAIQRAKLDACGLTPFFDAVVISGVVGVGKPDPRIFRHALDALGASPDVAVMVGDSLERDIDGARNAGMRSVWSNYAGKPLPTGSPQPDGVVTAMEMLPIALEELVRG